MNSFEGRPLIITEERYQELVAKENKLSQLLATYPEIEKGQKLSPATKKYKNALSTFVKRVDEVLSCPEIVSVFQIAAVHGFQYKGPSLAQDIVDIKKLVGEK